MRIIDWSSDVCSSDLAFAGLAQFAIAFDGAFDRIDDPGFVEAGAGDLGLRGVFGTRTAEQQLVIFGALAVDAKDADLAGMMVAAGVDAARDLDLELANVELTLHVRKTLRNLLRQRSEEHTSELQSLMRSSNA